MKQVSWLAATATLVVCLFAACTPSDPTTTTSNLVLDPASLCNCTVGPNILDPCNRISNNWRHTVDDLLEVSAFDFEHGGFVGTECEGEVGLAWDWPPIYFNSWRPVTGFKMNMVGTLHHFNWSYSDDEDWNIHVIPTPPFAHLITDVEAAHDESADWHNKCGGPKCMEMEISPDKQLWNNPWFFKPGAHPSDADDNGFSLLEGRQMGFYGVWLMDANHDFGSEIHPAGQMWFKDHWENGFGSNGPFDIFWLMFMQDNTGRFDDNDNFDCEGLIGDNIPAGWEAWENSPRAGQFNIAFEVNPASEVVNFEINEIFSRSVVTANDAEARTDADDGTTHTLELNGRQLVHVTESQPKDDDLGVTFTNLCLQPDGRLRGFVTLKSRIGKDDDKDEEGFQVLYVTRSKSSTLPDIVRPEMADLDPVVLDMDEVDNSIKGTATGFAGVLSVVLEGDSSANPKDLEVATAQYTAAGKTITLKPQTSSTGKEITLPDVPLLEGGKVTITTASGQTMTANAPAMVFSPMLNQQALQPKDDPDAWPSMVAVVGGGKETAKPIEGKLLALGECSVKLFPVYKTYKGDEWAPDRRSAFADDLNGAIRAFDQEKFAKLFDSENPFNVSWKVTATHLESGKPVPVFFDDKPRPEGVQVRFFTQQFDKDSLVVKFLSPGSAGIIQCTLQAIVKDKKGKTVIIEHQLWSHGLGEFKTLEGYAGLIQALAGAKDQSGILSPAPKLKSDEMEIFVDVATRHARTVHSYIVATLKDKWVTVEELQKTLGLLKKFAEERP